MIITIKIKSSDEYIIFNNLDEYLTYIIFNDIIYLKFEDYNQCKLPDIFPNNLQILIFNKSSVIEFPNNLPTTLTSIYCYTSKIKTLPDLSYLINVEIIDIHDNYLEKIVNLLPPNIKTLDLSYNMLKEILIEIPYELASLDLSYNILSETFNLKNKATMLVSNSMYSDEYFFKITKLNTKFNHTNTINNYSNIIHNTHNTNIIYENKQNVHSSSIQNSVSKSVTQLIALTDNLQLRDIEYIIHQLEQHNKNYINYFFKLITFSNSSIKRHLTSWCSINDISTTHGITYKQLVKYVYAIIENHKDRNELEKIMIQEIYESVDYCFTGKFTRMINILSGFVEEITIYISPKEQMQSKIAITVKNMRKLNEKDKKIKIEVSKILDEFNIDNINERNAWLDEFNDDIDNINERNDWLDERNDLLNKCNDDKNNEEFNTNDFHAII